MGLTFRQKGIKKSVRNRILLLVLVFFASLLFFFFLLNHKQGQKLSEMTAPTLPTISVSALDTSINCLRGYVNEMDALYMRDAVVPLEKDRHFRARISTYGRNVDRISYEIRSLDTERKISEEEVKDFHKKGNSIRMDIALANLIEPGEEYLFVLTLKSGEEEIHYYTRILIPVGAHEKDLLAFTRNFHDKALAKDASALAGYMEPDAAIDDTSQLSRVTIHSTASQAAWGSFDGEVVGEPTVELKDISSDYSVFVYYYQMKRKGEGGKTEYFNVTEYFKVRWTKDRIYLLDYERNMEEILTGGEVTARDKGLVLGIIGDDPVYLSNETGTILAFVQAGELWEYDTGTGKLTRVFSFLTDDPTDKRAGCQDHAIRLLNIDETGTLDFVVYGYMNAGRHEGSSGLNLYHYDSATHRAEEETFLTSTKSFQILKAGFSDLLYQSTDHEFYIMVDGTLLRVNLKSLETKEILSGLRSDQYAVSDSGRYFSWTGENRPAGEIQTMDLETGKVTRVKAEKGTLIRTFAYLNDDLVYGSVEEKDVDKDPEEGQVPASTLIIKETGGKGDILKDYHRDGTYISGVMKEDDTLYLSRVAKSAGSYVPVDTDTIRSASGARNKAVDFVKTGDEVCGTVTTAQMKQKPVRPLAIESAGLVLAPDTRTISVRAIDTETRYYVYLGSQIIYAGSDVVKAIGEADREMGIVVDNTQKYIWKRGKKAYVNAFSGIEAGPLDRGQDPEAQALSALITFAGGRAEVHSLLAAGESPKKILTDALPDARVLDLAGCSLSEMLWYVSSGNPVYARTEDGAVLIIGYDSRNVFLFKPGKDRYETLETEKAEAAFAAAGNLYLSYIDGD